MSLLSFLNQNYFCFLPAITSLKAFNLINPSASLYDDAYSTFEKDEVYNQKDAEGFIRLNALRLVIAGKKQK
jgi:argininosuccinate synthase